MLKVGKKAPLFSLPNQDGTLVSLKDFEKKKIILYFYPKDDTPGCTEQACNLAENISTLKKKGFVVIGISKDSPKKHTKFIEKYQLPFPLLADEETKVNQQYGVWVEKKMYGKAYMGTARTTVVIDENLIVTHIIDKVDTKNHTQQILDLLKAGE